MTYLIIAIVVAVLCLLVAVGAVCWSAGDTMYNLRGLRTDIVELTIELRAHREQMRETARLERIVSLRTVGAGDAS